MGRMDGKVALVTGAARGQGRAHATRLAEEGAEIIAFDVCEPISGVEYEAATEEDLAQTVATIESLDRRVLARKGDVRHLADVKKVVADGLHEFGHIDVLVGNAGITLVDCGWEITEEDWKTQIEVNLTGCWRLAKAVIPPMIEAGNGGSIIFTASAVARRGMGNMAHYSASKSGVEGLCRELAVDCGPYGIRVNTVRPGSVHTKMLDSQVAWELFTPGQEDSTVDARRKAMLDILTQMNMLDLPWVEPEDIAAGVLFLASDEARMITGTSLAIDAGFAAH